MRVSFGEVDGDAWEAFCQKVLKLKYSDYQEVPAQFGGDLGIEGFTRSGLVFQCYCPDEPLTGKDLYEAQRDKITKDIGKLVRNATQIVALGTGQVREWHFLTPTFNSRHLHSHCRAKEAFVVGKSLPEIPDGFRIYVKDENDYMVERQTVLSAGGFRIHAADGEPNAGQIEAFSQSENGLVSTIEGKLQHLREPSTPDARAELTRYLVRDLLVGRQELEQINERYPEEFRAITRLKASKEAQIESRALTYGGSPGDLLKETLEQYRDALSDSLGQRLESALIDRLASEAVADWLGRCPLRFAQREVGNVH
jgi:hypothetical protein